MTGREGREFRIAVRVCGQFRSSKPVFATGCGKGGALFLRRGGKISYEPDGTHWVFHRRHFMVVQATKHVHEQTFPKFTAYPNFTAKYPSANLDVTPARSRHIGKVTRSPIFRQARTSASACSGTTASRSSVRRALRSSSDTSVKISMLTSIELYPGFGGAVPFKYARNYAFRGESARAISTVSAPSLSWNASAGRTQAIRARYHGLGERGCAVRP